MTEAIYGAGYGSISRAYESARKVLGMTPAARRAGGAGVRVRFTVVEQGLRQMLVAATDEGVCAIEFGNDPAELEARLRRHLPAAVIERFDGETTTRVAIAARRAELPPQALGLPVDVRDVAIRARLRSFLGYLERARGLGLPVLFNTTVTADNLREIPALARFFVGHADVVHLASFQVQADTGRGVKKRAPPWVNARAVSRLINQGAGVDLGFDFPRIGHPDCSRYAGCLVAGGAAAPLFDDPALVAALLARTEGMTFERHDRRALLRTCLGIALCNPGLWTSGIAFAARKIWELRRGLLASRGRLHKLSFHIHSFMDADRLERARCESCVFMAVTRDGPISMCVHNAKRDSFILQTVTVRSADGVDLWHPLGTGTVRNPASHPLKRLKGRTRRVALENRRRVRRV